MWDIDNTDQIDSDSTPMIKNELLKIRCLDKNIKFIPKSRIRGIFGHSMKKGPVLPDPKEGFHLTAGTTNRYPLGCGWSGR